jgi:mannose-6-phosphate isomerase-like protein (cupin superfamily)
MKNVTADKIAPAGDEPGSPQRRWLEGFAGTLMALRSSSEQANGAYAIFECVVDPLRGSPLHFYMTTDTVYEPLDGCLRFACDAEEFYIPAGHRVAIPRGTHQAWRNDTEMSIRFLTTFVPGGIETLFSQIGGLSTRELDERMKPYGAFIVGPGLGEDLLTDWPKRHCISAR